MISHFLLHRKWFFFFSLHFYYYSFVFYPFRIFIFFLLLYRFYSIFILFFFCSPLLFFFFVRFLFHFPRRSVDIFNAIRCYRPLWASVKMMMVGPAMTLSLLADSFSTHTHTKIRVLHSPLRLILPLCTHPASAGNPSSTRDHANTHTQRTHCTDMQNGE